MDPVAKLLAALAAAADLKDATLAELAEMRSSIVAGMKAVVDADANLSDEAEAAIDKGEESVKAIDAAKAKAQGKADKAAKVRQLASASPGPRTRAKGALAVLESVRLAVEDDPKRGYGTGHADEKPFDGFGRYARDVAASAIPHGHPLKAVVGEPSEAFTILASMSQGSLPDGGIFTPPAFSSAVWDGAREQSDSLLQYCDVFPMDGGTESLEFPAVAETSRANGSRWGGVQGRWKGETTQMTDSSPKHRGVKFEPQELYLFTKVTDKLLRNVAALSSRLGTIAVDELNFKIGDAIINGTGSGQPKGVLAGTAGTDACRIEVAKETGQAAATVVKENIDKMWQRCLKRWRSGAAWFINQDVEAQLEGLSASVGTGGVPVYLPAGGIADTPNARLKGRPVIPIEYAATLGTVGDIMLLNLKAYGVAYRGLVDSAVSMHLYFDTAQTAFRWIVEVDGQPWMKDAITAYKGTSGKNTYSPFVCLATRA